MSISGSTPSSNEMYHLGGFKFCYDTAAKHRIYSQYGQYPDPITNTNRNQAKWLVAATCAIIGVTYDYGVCVYFVMQRVCCNVHCAACERYV